MHPSRVKGRGVRIGTRVAVAAGLLLTTMGSPLPTASAEPTAEQLRDQIRQYIAAQETSTGAFKVADPRRGGKARTLTLVRVHERVGKTGNYYYSCTDMKDVATGDLLDLDFDVSDEGGALKVVAVRIHKDNGKPRYTYDANDRMIPVKN